MQFFCIKMNTGYSKTMTATPKSAGGPACLTLALALLCLALPAAAGSVLAPGQRLFVLKTEHFDIIYPIKSEPSARRLCAIAEEVYAEVSLTLGSSLPSRVPVVVTPDLGVFNGFANPFPYMHIVLYDTPLDLGWTAFKDNFRGLFLHELTHALSLQIKAPWASFLSGIFGSWAAPALLNAPSFMVEGVAVSLESADGFGGRANDPLVRERLRQDIIENSFKTPIEAEGVYDEYPGGDIYYEYGGLFNAYLQKKYGMDKYDELWRAMGNLIWSASLDVYDQGFFKAFRKVYGARFPAAWADFRLSMTILGTVDPPEVLSHGPPSDIGGLASGGGSLFWVDARSSTALQMDVATLETSLLFDASPGDQIADASADGHRLLVTRTVTLPDGRNRIEASVYDASAGRFQRGSELRDLREGKFFREGFVGIQSNLHNTDLVYLSGGKKRILLPGSESVAYAQPTMLDDSRLALIVAVGGTRSIGILDVDSGRLRLLRPRGEPTLLEYVRQLSAFEGRLYFNYDSDDRMYKLGRLEGEELFLETADYSGGVFMPREEGGRIYYAGRFAEGTRICRYPGAAAAVGRGAAGGQGRELGLDYEDFDPALAAMAELQDTPASSQVPALPYRTLDYANPFTTWILYPDLATLGQSTRLLALFYLQDPIQDNSLLVGAGYDFAHPFALGSLAWTNTALPLRIAASLGDSLVYGSSSRPERQSSLSLQTGVDLPALPGPRMASLGLGASLLARSRGEAASPYAWSYDSPAVALSGTAAWLGRIPGAAVGSSRGLDLVSYHDYDLASRSYKTEAQATLAWDEVPIRLDLWGAWAGGSILSLDSQSPVFAADKRPPYFEYETWPGRSTMLAQGSAAWRIANQGIHANILGLYFNRFLLDLGYRGAWFEAAYLQSCFARLSLDLAAGLGAAGGVGLQVFAEGFARLSEGDPGRSLGIRIGLQTNLDGELAQRGGRMGGMQ